MAKRNPILRSIYRSLPPKGRQLSRFVYEGVRSLWDFPLKNQLFGDKADLIPPFYLMQDGPADYKHFKQSHKSQGRRGGLLNLFPTLA
jgi:hypothetical protein